MTLILFRGVQPSPQLYIHHLKKKKTNLKKFLSCHPHEKRYICQWPFIKSREQMARDLHFWNQGWLSMSAVCACVCTCVYMCVFMWVKGREGE